MMGQQGGEKTLNDKSNANRFGRVQQRDSCTLSLSRYRACCVQRCTVKNQTTIKYKTRVYDSRLNYKTFVTS